MNSQFLHSLSEMLFSSAAEKKVLEQLHIVAFKQCQEHIARLEDEVIALQVVAGNEVAYTKLRQTIGYVGPDLRKTTIEARILEKRQEITAFEQQKNKIKADAKGVNLEQATQFDEQFIDEFAKKFNNIDDLTTTLSDAPEGLKNLLPQFYAKLFLKLDKAEQEAQLAKLYNEFPDKIDLILNTSLKMYKESLDAEKLRDAAYQKFIALEENKNLSKNLAYQKFFQNYEDLAYIKFRANEANKNLPEEEAYRKFIEQDNKMRQESQQLVHMILFEVVRKRSEAVPAAKKAQPDYKKRQAFLVDLLGRIPSVGASDIIDSLSDYQNSNGQTIGNILYQVDNKLNINATRDYSDHSVLQAYELRHKLRLGRSDIRDHVQQYQKNVARDLFWARNLRDLELFTKGGTDQIYEDLVVLHAFNAALPVIAPQDHSAINSLEPDLKHVLNQFTDVLGDFSRSYIVNLDNAISGIDLELARLTNERQHLVLKIPTTVRTTKIQSVVAKLTAQIKQDELELSKLMETYQSHLKIYTNLSRSATATPQQKDKARMTAENYLEQIGTLSSKKSSETEELEVLVSELRAEKENTKVESEPVVKQNKNTASELDRSMDALNTQKKNLEDKKQYLNSFPSRSRGKISDLQRATIIDDMLMQFNETLKIKEIENGRIEVDFFYISKTDLLTENIRKKIEANQGFGSKPDTLVQSLHSSRALTAENCLSQKITGTSLSDIRKQILDKTKELENKNKGKTSLELEAYQNYLKVLDQKIAATNPQPISALELSASDELLLRKLLELRVYYLQTPPIPKELALAFNCIKNGQYAEAVKTPKLDESVSCVYEQIARLSINKVPPALKEIVEKIQTIAGSNKIRADRLAEYNAVWTSKFTQQKQVDEITRIFSAEYTEMQKTLGLGAQELENLKKDDIKVMAEDLVRLTDRVEKGEPIISLDEQKAYFQAISAIQQAIHPLDLSQVSFKVKHSLSSTQPQTIEVTGPNDQLKSIQISLGVKLPYSLIKPPGESECMFSFGGSRGNVGPFAGLEKVYGKKKRYFTASRELGEGQYGAVKFACGLLYSVNYAIKKVMTSDAFTEEARQNPRLRAITSRQEILADREVEALMKLNENKADDKTFDGSSNIACLKKTGKSRPGGKGLHQENRAQETTTFMKVASGQTFADTEREESVQFSKADEAYHNPVKRRKGTIDISEVATKLLLAEAVVAGAQQFSGKFSHNDIKPENFLYKKRADGSYKVSYIDWATQGAQEKYVGTAKTEKDVFKEKYGDDGMSSVIDGVSIIFNAKGQFARKMGGTLYFGVQPHLQILHGARNCTVPYISPALIWPKDTSWESEKPGVKNPDLDTVIDGNDSRMDDWALTAMTFGICNRKAYFALASGRVVNDYKVPGVLDKSPDGALQIQEPSQYDTFFACEKEDLVTGKSPDEIANNKQAVMYIPSNTREGGPLHLYRLLKEMKENCDKDPRKKALGDEIGSILKIAHESIASGKGLSKQVLTAQFTKATALIKQYQKLSDPSYKESVQKTADFESALKACERVDVNGLFKQAPNGVKYLEILCTYPTDEAQQHKALNILDKAINTKVLHDKFLSENAPGQNMFSQCIAGGQGLILRHLLSQVTTDDAGAFKALVAEQGLLHLAMQTQLTVPSDGKPQERTEVARLIIDTLTLVGVSPDEIFKLMLKEYRPTKEKESAPAGLNWSTNAFTLAIRNNNSAQLALVLKQLPKDAAAEEALKKALHLSANLSHPDLFNQILATKRYFAQDILSMNYPPDNTSPYHLFLRQATMSNRVIADLTQTKNKSLISSFLLTPPENTKAYPCLIAAAHGNMDGLERLFNMAEEVLDPQQKIALFTQTDAFGKNLLNHILEQKQLQYLPQFIQHVKKLCPTNSSDVLLQMLTNMNPVDPLRNFLETDASVATKFELMGVLLDSVAPQQPEKRTDAQEKARLVALLVNQDWLIEQAGNSSNHEALRTLLRNPSLSNPNQQLLFKILDQQSKQFREANKLYSGFLGEVMPSSPAESAERTALLESQIPDILKAVTLQRSDVGEFLKKLVQSEQEMAEKINLHIKKINDGLQNAQEKLTAQTRLAETAQEKVVSLGQSIQLKEAECSALTLKMKAAEQQYLKSLTELEEKKALDLKSAKFKEDLSETMLSAYEQKATELTDQYCRDKAESSRLLVLAEEKVGLLGESLKTSKIDLEVSQKTVARVMDELRALEDTNAELEKNVYELKGENKELTEQLALQDKKITDTTEKARKLNEKLEASALNIVDLQRRVDSLETENASLKKQVVELSHEISEVRSQLKIEQQQVTGTKEKLADTLSELEAAKSTLQLLQRANEDNKTLQLRLEEAEMGFQLRYHDLEMNSVAELRKITEAGGNGIEVMRQSHANNLAGLTAEHTKKINDLKREYQEEKEQALATSQQNISELKDKISELQESMLKQAATLIELQDSLADYQEQNKALQDAQKLSGEANKKLSAQLLEQQNLVGHSKKDATVLSEELRTLSSQILEFQRQVENLTVANGKLRDENVNLKTRVNYLDEKVETLTLEAATATEEAHTAQTKLLETAIELKSTQEAVSRLEKDIVSVQDDYAKKVALLQEQYKEAGFDLKSAMDAAKDDYLVKLADFKRHLQVSTEKVGALESLLNKTAAELREREAKVLFLSSQNEGLLRENKRFTNELRESKETNKMSEVLLASQDRTLRAAQANVRALEQSNTEALQTNEKQKAELLSLKTAHDDLAKKNPELQVKWQEAEQQVEELTREVEILRAKQSASEKLEPELEHKVSDLTHRIELIMVGLRQKAEENEVITARLTATGLSLDRATSDVDAVRTELALKKREHAEIVEKLQDDLAIAQKEGADVSFLNQQLEDENKRHEEGAKALVEQLENSIQSVRGLEQEILSQTNELENRQLEIIRLKALVERSLLENTVLQKELDEANQSHEVENTALREQLEIQRRSTEQAQKMLGQLEASLKESLSNGAKWKLSAHVLVARNKQLKQTVQNLEQQLVCQVGDLESRLKDVSHTMREEKQHVLEVTEQLRTTTAALEVAQREALLIREAADRMKHQHAAEVALFQAAMTPLRVDKDKNQVEIARLQKELEQVNNQYDADKAASMDRLKISTNKIKELEPLIDVQKGKITHQQTAIGILEWRVKDIQRRNTQLKQRVARTDIKNARLIALLAAQSETSAQQIESLKSELDESYSKTALLEKNMEAILRKNEAVLRENSTLGIVILGLTEDVRTLTAQLGAKGDEVAQSRVEIEKTRQALARAEALERGVNAAFEALTEEHEQLISVHEEALQEAGLTKEQVASLQTAISTQFTQYEKELNTLQQELEAAQQSVDIQHERLWMQSAELERRQTRVIQLTERLAHFREQNSQLIDELALSKETQQGERKKFEKQLAEQQLAMKTIETSLGDLRVSHERTVTENEHLKVAMEEWTEERAGLTTNVTKLTEQVKQLTVDFARVHERLEAKNDDVKRLEQTLFAAESKLAGAVEEAKQLRATHYSAEREYAQEVHALQLSLVSANSDKQHDAEHISLLEGHINALDQQHAIDMTALRQQLDEVSERETSLNSEVGRSRHGLSDSESQVESLSSEMELLQRENYRLRDELNAGGGVGYRDLIRQLDQQGSYIDRLIAERDNLLSSVAQTKITHVESSLLRLEQELERREAGIKRAITNVKSLSAMELNGKYRMHLDKLQKSEREFTECINTSADTGFDNDRFNFVNASIRRCRELLQDLEHVISHTAPVEQAALEGPPVVNEEPPPVVEIAGGLLRRPEPPPTLEAARPLPVPRPNLGGAEPPPVVEIPKTPEPSDLGDAAPPAVEVEAGPPKLKGKNRSIPLTIFSALDDKDIERATLFSPPHSPTEKPVIAIKYTVNELTDPESQARIKAQGLNVTTPSGQHYNLCIKDGVPKAVMSQSEARAESKEDPDQHKQRVAVSIMNMIDNILPYSDSVNITTEDPFIAEIARQYIEYLGDKPGLRNVSLNLKISKVIPDAQKQQAADIFTRIKPAIESNLNQEEPKEKEAKTINFSHFKHKLQLAKESGAANEDEDEKKLKVGGPPPQ